MTDFTPSVADYPYTLAITTRPQDCDALGYISNVVFYSFFDTAVSQFLAERCELDISQAAIVPQVTRSQCQYMTRVSYPEPVVVGLRLIKLARNSATFGLSVYAGEQQRRAAHGQFMQVFVERTSGKVVPVPEDVHRALQALAEDFE